MSIQTTTETYEERFAAYVLDLSLPAPERPDCTVRGCGKTAVRSSVRRAGCVLPYLYWCAEHGRRRVRSFVLPGSWAGSGYDPNDDARPGAVALDHDKESPTYGYSRVVRQWAEEDMQDRESGVR